MAPSYSPLSSDPLLGTPSKGANDNLAPPLSTTAQVVIKALAVIRLATGAACLIAPRFTCALFRYPVPVEQTLLVRMFGVRDAVFGELLVTAEKTGSKDGGRREIKRAIWAGIGADVVDLGSLAFAVGMGHVGKAAGGLLGFAAVGAIGLGAIGLRGL